uniref:RH1 domain-containing protein n=1 Tax=Elaeophora elaphi TaxID=1147741 RepID=A0A0R3RHE3_9BILA
MTYQIDEARVMQEEMDAVNVEGPRLPTLMDLKNRLRTEPLYLQVLEDYLHNAANLIEDLRARLRRREAQDDETMEVSRADLMYRASLPPTREQLEEFREALQHRRDLEREYENEDQIVLHLLERQQQVEPEHLEEEPVSMLVESENDLQEEMESSERRQAPRVLFLNEESDVVTEAPAVVVPERRGIEAVREIKL